MRDTFARPCSAVTRKVTCMQPVFGSLTCRGTSCFDVEAHCFYYKVNSWAATSEHAVPGSSLPRCMDEGAH
jgi:hypothetical protein